jgi:hypothetical protein
VSKQNDKLFVEVRMSLPEDALVPGELELIQAYLAGLIDRVIQPAVDSDPLNEKDQPWP